MSQTNWLTDGQTNRTYFIEPLPIRFDHTFQKFESKIFLNYLASLWLIWKETVQEIQIPSTKFSVQWLQKEWSLANSCKITFILIQWHRSMINPLNFISFCCCERVHDNKQFSLGNLILNPKSRPIKENSTQHHF